MLVKPTEGLVIRDPATKRVLPPEGITAPDGDLDWTRSERFGDVTLSADPEPADPEPVSTSDQGDK